MVYKSIEDAVKAAKKNDQRAYGFLDELIKSQNIDNLLEKVKKLKPTYEKVIRMKYFEEMTYKDISHRTQIPLNTIKVMILRAKKILAELISNENSTS